MRVERIPSKDIGLRHVLENGLALIEGADLGEHRKEQVLQSLHRIFSEADRGSQALGVYHLTAALNEKRAIERFSAFYHHLRHEFGEAVPARLGQANDALADILENGSSDAQRTENLRQVLRLLLESIRRERALAPLRRPQEISY